MAQSAPIAVYGASGYTGRLVVREAVRRGLDLVLVGRSRDRLRAAAQDAGADAPIHEAAVDEPHALRHALGDCAVVINCAGPFTHFGEPVVRAAVDTGTHYCDTTGEQPYMQRIFERHDERARAADVAVVTAVGFDYVPGDLICRLAARGREPLEELVVAYWVEGFGATRGTMHSALEIARGGDLAFVDGALRPAGAGPLRAHFTFPRAGRRPVGKYPSGEIVTVPRHTRTRKVTSLIGTAAFAPHPAAAPLMPFLLPAVGLGLRTPLKSLLDLAIDRLPEGPSEESRARARFEIVALARGADGSTGRGTVRGSDPYGLTAVTAVRCAELMADQGYDRAGALSPASAYDPVDFLDHLGAHGVSYELDRAVEPAAV